MNRKTCLSVVVLMSVIGAAVARTGSPAGPLSTPDGSAIKIPAGAPEHTVQATPREKLSPMHREIFDAVEAERAQVEALSDRYALAVLPGQKLEIQKEIEAAKKAGIISVFEIQLRYARAEGRDPVVHQLENAIDAVKTPKIPQGSGPTVLEKAAKTAR